MQGCQATMLGAGGRVHKELGNAELEGTNGGGAWVVWGQAPNTRGALYTKQDERRARAGRSARGAESRGGLPHGLPCTSMRGLLGPSASPFTPEVRVESRVAPRPSSRVPALPRPPPARARRRRVGVRVGAWRVLLCSSVRTRTGRNLKKHHDPLTAHRSGSRPHASRLRAHEPERAAHTRDGRARQATAAPLRSLSCQYSPQSRHPVRGTARNPALPRDRAGCRPRARGLSSAVSPRARLLLRARLSALKGRTARRGRTRRRHLHTGYIRLIHRRARPRAPGGPPRRAQLSPPCSMRRISRR